jgi:hypothetical protein
MENLIELNDNEYSEVWDRVCKNFNFSPSVHKKDWPSFQEPAPFITYDISKISKYEDCIVNEWNEIALRGMKECTDEDELVYILDWSHQFYLILTAQKQKYGAIQTEITTFFCQRILGGVYLPIHGKRLFVFLEKN